MAYFKYIPYLFLLITLLFIIEAVSKYNEGSDPLPYILLAVCGVAMFFVRRNSYKRYQEPKK
ncbi:hypothetical protein [Flavobacterium psychrotrophum]|uniref:hypothetical protein n=1 Tax=Flavobacterium psychrotrophum TaxID=2294119 RepID=UPI000E3147AC|nr:hypothetical protein [Flavobacterium psychrotrophum]